MKYEVRYAVGHNEFKGFGTQELRDNFLINDLFQKDIIKLCYTHYDRYIAGGAFPVNTPLKLEPIDPIKAAFFLERRELGVINIGGPGSVSVDGEKYDLNFKEGLYVGKDNKEIIFSSLNSSQPAKFYLNSAPAHKSYPTKKVTREDANQLELGDLKTSNDRTVNQLLVQGIVDTCQLQMGFTELKTGSVWNTMPAHVHDRRMEVYFYFEVPEDQAVCHFMGQTDNTRHLWLSNEQAAISPPWSLHSGAGTSNYTFIWGMAGENLDYSDMDVCDITDLR